MIGRTVESRRCGPFRRPTTSSRCVSTGSAFRRLTHFPSPCRRFGELYELEFPKPVTLLVGENGSGKSTIEAPAVASGFSEEGGTRNMDFVEPRSQSGL